MSFTVMHRDGGMENGDPSQIPALVAELNEPRDDEHPDIAVTDDETGWTLSAFQTGRLVWENVEDDGVAPRHLTDVSRPEVTRLMLLIAHGSLPEVENLPWQSGY